MIEYWPIFLLEAVAAVFFGLWLSERKTRLYIQNMQTYGTAELGTAEVWMPSMERPSSSRAVPEDGSAPSWSDDTVGKGVADLMRQSIEQGQPITHAEALEEVMLMLNSEDGDMQ